MPSPTKSHVGTSKKPRIGELERSKEKLMAITQKHNEVVINNVAHRQRIKELENEVYDLKDEVIALSKQNVALIAEVARLRRRPTARTLGNPDETKILLGVVNSLLLSVPALSLLRDQLVATPATPPRATSIPPSLWTPKFNPHGPFKTSQSPQGLNGLTEEDEEDFDSDDEDENGPTNYLPASLSIPESSTSVPNPPRADHLTDLTSRSQARASRASRRSSGLVAVPQLLVPPPPPSSVTISRSRKSKSPTPELEDDGYRDHETMGTIPDEIMRDDNLSTNPTSFSEPLQPRVLYELTPLRDGGSGKGKGREIPGTVSDMKSPLEPLAIKVESVAQTPITNLHNQPSPLLVGPVEPAASSRKVGPSVAVSASQPPRPTPSRPSTTSQRSTLSSVQSQARVPPTRPTSAASSNASASSSSSESSTARARATAAAAFRTKSSSTTTTTIPQSSSTSRIQAVSTPSSSARPSSNLKSSASSSTSTTIAATSSALGSKAPMVRMRDVADALRRGVTTAPAQPSPASSSSAVSAPVPPQAKDKPPMAPTALVQPEEEEQQSSQTDEPSFGPATEASESPESQGADEGAAADGGVDGAAARRARRVSKAINYKEPSLTKKMRDESRVAERKSTSSRPSTTSRPTNSARISTTPRPHSPRPTTAAPTSGGATSSSRSVSPALLREDEDELTAAATANVTSVASAGTRRKSVLPPRKTVMAAAGSAGKKRAAVAAVEESESDMATSENESLSSTSEAGNGEEEDEALHPFDVASSLSAKSRRPSTTTAGITTAARTQTAREALDRHWAESTGETTPKASHQQQAKMAAPTAARRTSSFAQGLPLAEKNGLAENSRDHREEAEGMVKKVVGKRRASSRVSGIGA